MSCKLRILLGTWMVALALLAVGGCGPTKESTPPKSDSVTTDALNIELPSGDKAGTQGQPSGKTEASPPKADEPKGQKPS